MSTPSRSASHASPGRALAEVRRLRAAAARESWRADLARWPADLREVWEERAAIREFDGGLRRPRAEAAAYRDLRGSSTGAEGPTELQTRE